ncbi:MAG: hypothetical protein KGY99_02925 [Phycisphaerae bacterium]|nr:hypothetical protein [Phycisphaerae bacterium]
MNKGANILIILGAIAVCVWTGHLLIWALGGETGWWTPSTDPLTLADSRDRVEVLVDGTLIQRRIAEGEVLLRRKGGTESLTRDDVGIRFNNVDRVRASRRWPMTVAGGLIGAGAVMLIWGLAWRFGRWRPPVTA